MAKAIEPAAFKTGVAAAYTGMSRRTLTDKARAGEIPYSRISARLHLFRKADLDAYLDRTRIGGRE